MLKLLLGDPNTRKLKRYQPIVTDINLLEEDISPLSDDELRQKTIDFRSQLKELSSLEKQRELLDELFPETFAVAIKKGLPIEAKFSGYKNKIYNGEVDTVSSRINADTRSLLTRIKIENKNFELIPGSLLEVTVKYNERNSLSVPDTSIMLEGNKAYVYKVSTENITNRVEIIIGSRSKGNVEVLSGLVEGDLIVAEGLKKVRPRGQIKPIKK